MISTLLDLFLSFLKVGSFSFGGAYSLIPLIESEVVKNHQWMTNEEFLKILGIVEAIPGAISIKFATYTGYKVAGIPGALAANLGNLITPAILILTVFYFYQKFENNVYFMRAFNAIKYAVIGMIIAVMAKYFINAFADYKNLIFVLGGFVLVYFAKSNPFLIISGTAILGMIIYKWN